MLRRVVLHFGPPKTGTTSIQNALSLFGEELAGHGFCYPITKPESNEGQPSLAWDVLEQLGKRIERESKAYVSWDSAFAQAEGSGAHTLIVSSETFVLGSFDDEAFRLLRTILGDLDVVVVFALRDPLATVASVWNQAVKWGYGGVELCDLNSAVPLLATHPSVRVVPYLQMTESCLNPVEVRLFTVPTKPNTEVLLGRFAEAALLPTAAVSAFSELELPIRNQSIAPEQTSVLLQLNRLLQDLDSTSPSASAITDSHRFEARLEARRLVLESMRNSGPTGPTSHYLSENSYQILDNIRSNLLSWLQGRQVIGELADLEGSHSGPVTKPPEANMKDVAALVARTLESACIRYTDNSGSYLGQVEETRDWWRHRAEHWKESASSLAESRDWWKSQAESRVPAFVLQVVKRVLLR